MTVLVAVETLILALLSLLVVGLLRSHAEILRRLGPVDEDADAARDAALMPDVLPNPPDGPGLGRAKDIGGSLLSGDAAKYAIASGGQNVLLAFLSSSCLVCERFWDAFQPPDRPEIPGESRLIIVAKDSSHESPSKLRKLAPPDIPVLLSGQAWKDYEVPGAPYFVYVDGRTGNIAGEGAALEWAQVLSLLQDAITDVETAEAQLTQSTAAPRRSLDKPPSPAERNRMADEELIAAGISPDDPSLWRLDDVAESPLFAEQDDIGKP